MQISDPAAYHGYWQQDLNSLNSKFGTAADLQALSSALHSRGMYLMVDIVVNHFGWQGNSSSVDYSKYAPFNKQSYFHSFCQITQTDYDNDDQANIEQCWLGNSVVELPDVNTTQPSVINTYNSWISDLVSTYGIDGLRIDSVKCTQQSFFPDFNMAAGVYAVGEVAHGDPDYVCPYTNYLDGVLNYPLYYPLTAAFSSTSGDMSRLKAMINQVKAQCKDDTLMAPFLENHDQPRFPSMTSDMSLIRNAILTTLMMDGPPIIYQGQEWALASTGDPTNREAIWLQPGAYAGTGVLHGWISQINQIRNFLTAVSGGQWGLYANNPIYVDNNNLVLRKGYDESQSITIVTNQAENGGKVQIGLSSNDTGWSAGEDVYELIGCGGVTVGSNGTFIATVQGGVGQIWVAKSLASGSGICGL
ncbi:MAG: hypothetical protein Q9227_006430 [Pyrenula ochraceoflavens]